MAKLHAAALSLALCLLALLAPAQAQDLAPIPPLDSPVVDTTGTLDAGTRQALEARARALQQRKGSQLQILMVPTTQPEDIAQYAVRAFDQYRLGREKVDDGVLLVIAKDDRRARIEVGYGLEGAIPDAIAMRVIQEYLVPHFRQGDYAGGIEAATAALTKLIDGEPLPAPMASQDVRGDGRGSGSGWLFALVAAMIVAQVARGVLGRAPRAVRGVGAALAAGGIAWLLSSLLFGIVGGVIGLFFGFASASGGRFARDRSWGGYVGGWGGGGGFGGGGFGGGGWGGGGGMSGGGGASGSW